MPAGGDGLRAAAVPAATLVPDDTARDLTFGGFIDTCYAFDVNRPAASDRQYTTQPARHDEFNVNLAFVELTLAAPRTHARLFPPDGYLRAVQPLRRAADRHREGPLVADSTPNYQSGARLLWQTTPALAVQADLVNGWQHVSKSNASMAGGLRLDYTPTPTTTLSLYSVVVDEAPDSVHALNGSLLRLFHGVGAKLSPPARRQLLVELEGGQQRRGDAQGGWAGCWGTTAVARYLLTPSVVVAGRVGRFDDPGQMLIATGVADGYRANGL